MMLRPLPRITARVLESHDGGWAVSAAGMSVVQWAAHCTHRAPRAAPTPPLVAQPQHQLSRAAEAPRRQATRAGNSTARGGGSGGSSVPPEDGGGSTGHAHHARALHIDQGHLLGMGSIGFRKLSSMISGSRQMRACPCPQC